MKIQFVIGDISAAGGTERVTTEIAAGLSAAGHEVTILSLFGPATPWFDLPQSVHVRAANLLPAAGGLRRAAVISSCLWHETRRPGQQVIVLVDTILFAFCVPWIWSSKAKVVCWEHFSLTTNHGTRMRDLARFAASRLSDRIVVLTRRDATDWSKKFRITNRVQSIWNPIPKFTDKSSTELQEGAKPQIVLSVGRLSHEKGFDLLLNSWRLLDDSREGWVLRIVGGGVEEVALKAQAKELDIADSVVFTGHVRDVENEYRAASLYALSSRWEGFSMALLEAQHFGVPCVAADCPHGPREVLDSGSGLLVEPEDPLKLAEAMAKLMRSPFDREHMARLARQNAKRFRLDVILREWEILFFELSKN